jgi:hypothetical protein
MDVAMSGNPHIVDSAVIDRMAARKAVGARLELRHSFPERARSSGGSLGPICSALLMGNFAFQLMQSGHIESCAGRITRHCSRRQIVEANGPYLPEMPLAWP